MTTSDHIIASRYNECIIFIPKDFIVGSRIRVESTIESVGWNLFLSISSNKRSLNPTNPLTTSNSKEMIVSKCYHESFQTSVKSKNLTQVQYQTVQENNSNILKCNNMMSILHFL